MRGAANTWKRMLSWISSPACWAALIIGLLLGVSTTLLLPTETTMNARVTYETGLGCTTGGGASWYGITFQADTATIVFRQELVDAEAWRSVDMTVESKGDAYHVPVRTTPMNDSGFVPGGCQPTTIVHGAVTVAQDFTNVTITRDGRQTVIPNPGTVRFVDASFIP